jgi:hypothetical protein
MTPMMIQLSLISPRRSQQIRKTPKNNKKTQTTMMMKKTKMMKMMKKKMETKKRKVTQNCSLVIYLLNQMKIL